MNDKDFNTFMHYLLQTTYSRNDGKSLTNAIDLCNTAEVCACNTPLSTKDYKQLDTTEVVEDLVNIVKQCYDECYSDDIPKEFIQKLYINIEKYLNEA
jgi:hypothetical protein